MDVILEILAQFIKAIFFCLLLLIAWTPAAILQGYILMMLWGWFIVPTGVHALSLGSAIGVSLIINLLTSHFTNVASEKDAFELCGFWTIFQLLILSVGYLIKTYGAGLLW